MFHKNVSQDCNLIKRSEIFENLETKKWPYVTFKIILYIMNKAEIVQYIRQRERKREKDRKKGEGWVNAKII